MKDEIRQVLIANGVTKQQANSFTAEAVVSALIPNEAQVLIKEAKAQVDEAVREVKSIGKTVSAIADAYGKYGTLSDTRAANALALYAAAMEINEKLRVDPNESAKAGSYMTWAYLSGSAEAPSAVLPRSEEENAEKD